MIQSYTDIVADFRKKKYAHTYLLMGEEAYYIDKVAEYAQSAILTDAEQEFDLTVMYGKEVTMEQVVMAAKRYPMMGKYQVVIVKEAQLISKWENIQFYMQQPLSTTILLFCYKYGTLNKNTKAYKALLSGGVVMESPKLRDYQMADWIKKYAQSVQMAIEEKAVVMIADSLGTDLSKVVNELDKLLLSKPTETRTITAELVEQNIGISKDFNVFELQSALVQGDVVRANRIINYFADNPKNNPMVLVLGQLFNFFSNLMIYHYLQDKRDSSVASVLKINAYFVKDYESASRRFNAFKTMNILSAIRTKDAQSKGVGNSDTSHGDLLKELIFFVLH